MIEFVIASHNPEILKANIMRSDVWNKYVFTIAAGFSNVAAAYNSVTTRAGNVVVYVHHDVFLPYIFQTNLLGAITNAPTDWGVLGVAGVRLVNGKKLNVGCILDRGRRWGQPLEGFTEEVDTLDELLLITRGDLRFDENMEQDFYGADICMQARLRGQKCYVIDAYCHHNSGRGFGERTESFYKSQEYFRNKWEDQLPIATTCALLMS
jgi:hypothetical protein